MQVKKPQLELDMEQRTGSKLGKEYIKAVYCHPAYLTYMQNTSCEMPDHLTNLLRNLYAVQETIVRTGHGTMDWFKRSGKEDIKVVYFHPDSLTYTQSTS